VDRIGIAVMTTAVGAYFSMLVVFAKADEPPMWPSWWVAVPVGFFVIGFLITVSPLVGKKRAQPDAPVPPLGQERPGKPVHPEEPARPGPSIEIGGPGVKVGRVSITDSYSNNPQGLAGIFGAEIQDAQLERNIHDVPPRQTADQQSDDEDQDDTDD
jgi:hypothetical protein